MSFSLPEKSFVTLRVYDILGREIAVLLNNELNTGNHSINWDASNYPSGVYFYKIEAGSFTESKNDLDKISLQT
ncbi:MAG: T9SS type A sorting domain-containing protein [Ignavibacteria bacterium]|nr:T9SS type A sorting domain-containing protein [Ignavibacteria bacterium]